MNKVDLSFWVQLGLGAGMLAILYLGLARGAIWTDRSVQKLLELLAKQDAYKDARIASLEQLVSKLDERNDRLSSNVEKVLELAHAQGLVEALPPHVR